MNNKLKF